MSHVLSVNKSLNLLRIYLFSKGEEGGWTTPTQLELKLN